jgi:hypothetical protein
MSGEATEDAHEGDRRAAAVGLERLADTVSDERADQVERDPVRVTDEFPPLRRSGRASGT